MKPALVEVDKVSFRYGETAVCRGVSLWVKEGEMLALLGASGCGKTTLLKLIAGLLRPDKGEIRFDREAVTAVPTEKRSVGFVFQKPLLFPHLTVGENVGFGLKMRGAKDGATRVREALELVRLGGFEGRRATELSGGQEQRVALARALVTEPRVLLLDEPFSALEAQLRAEMGMFVRELQQRLGTTSVFVTHDQEEAAALADRIALMAEGKVEQVGAPQEFYTAPGTARTARFFGWQVFPGDWLGIGMDRIRYCAFRPEAVEVSADRAAAGIPGVVIRVVTFGQRVRLTVRTGRGDLVEAEQWGGAGFCVGDPVRLRVPVEAMRFFND